MIAGAPGRVRFAMIAVVLLQVVACSSSPAGSAGPTPAPDTVRVGLVLSLTGSVSTPSEPVIQGAHVALAEINARGAAGKLKVELVQVDDAGKPATAGQVCSRLISVSRVVAILGAESPASQAACVNVTHSAGIPYFAATAEDGEGCPADVFHLGPVPAQKAAGLVGFLAAQRAFKTFYLIGTASAPSQTLATAASNEVLARGLAVAGIGLVSADPGSVTTALDAISRSAADVVVDAAQGDAQVIFDRQLAADPRTARLARASLDMQAATAIAIGPGSVGSYVVQDYLAEDTSPANQSWLAAISRAYGDGSVPSASGAQMYDALELFVAALGRAGSADGKAIAAATPGASVSGPRGPIEIKPSGHGYASLLMHIGRIQANYGSTQLSVSSAIDPAVSCT